MLEDYYGVPQTGGRPKSKSEPSLLKKSRMYRVPHRRKFLNFLLGQLFEEPGVLGNWGNGLNPLCKAFRGLGPLSPPPRSFCNLIQRRMDMLVPVGPAMGSLRINSACSNCAMVIIIPAPSTDPRRVMQQCWVGEDWHLGGL